MKALQFSGPNQATVEEVDVPTLGPGEVLIRSHAVGICHSDFELLEGRYIIPFAYPITPGHEWSGEVVDMGRAVAGFQKGDRVVGECVVGPGGRDHFGFNISGAAAEYFKVNAEWLHKIPDALTYTQGALVEPFSVAYNAVRNLGGVDPSDTVAILGGGPIGLLSLFVVLANGARAVVVEPQIHRREMAIGLGAFGVLDPGDASFRDGVRDLTGGRGFDGVIEAAGAPSAMAMALDLVGHGGRIAFAGINIGSSVPAALGLIQSKSLQIRGLIGSIGVWPQTIRFMAQSAVDPAQIVSRTYPIASATDALAAARDTQANLKVHIRTSE